MLRYWRFILIFAVFTNAYGEQCSLSIHACSIIGCKLATNMEISIPVRQESRILYDRYDYTGGQWSDDDGDCRNTRADLLEATSLIPVVRSKDGCVVKLGLWYDPYSDASYEFAHDLDIDHLVPLKEAHESGADKWSKHDRANFANEYIKSANLIPVWSSMNRSKGAKEPLEWLPPHSEYVCEYVNRWTYVKWYSGLSMDRKECEFIKRSLAQCP